MEGGGGGGGVHKKAGGQTLCRPWERGIFYPIRVDSSPNRALVAMATGAGSSVRMVRSAVPDHRT